MSIIKRVLFLIASGVTIFCSFGLGRYFGESKVHLAYYRNKDTENPHLGINRKGEVFSAESADLKKLKDIVIPYINFEKLTLHEAMFAISADSVDYDPEGKGVHICLGMVGRHLMNTNTVSFHGTNVTLGVIVNELANSVNAECVTRPSILFQWVEGTNYRGRTEMLDKNRKKAEDERGSQ